jgi:pimeloyl-ACP methyl ester carboxylesterase
VEDRDPDLLLEVQRVREVLLQREAENRDRVRVGHVVGTPGGAWRAVIQPVERLVRSKPLLAALARRRLVSDHDGHIAERCCERRRDARERAIDEGLELDVSCVAVAATLGKIGGGDSAVALRHGNGIVGRMEPIKGPGLSLLDLRTDRAPEPDPEAEPAGFIVISDDGTRIHFLDWGGPSALGPERAPGVLLIPGLAHTGWTWAPVARRLRTAARVVAMDMRGHGLSDAPTGGYDPDSLAGDAIAVAEGSGLLSPPDDPVAPSDDAGAPFVVAGHGFGAVVAAWVANALGERCAGLVLVDGGWEDVGGNAAATPDEWLAAIEEPPEVLASMDAWLADRRAFDPASWDRDQERAARAQVVETAAGRVKLAVHPHALAGSVRALLAYEPAVVLPTVEAQVVALAARDDEAGSRWRALTDVAVERVRAGHVSIAVASFPGRGHNLPRYEPAAVTAAILLAPGTISG